MRLPIQNISLRGVFILGGGITLVVVILSIVVSFFVTVTYQDAVLKTEHISARKLTDPRPGKLFEIVDGKILGRPLCNLVLTDSDISGRDKIYRYKFSNVIGRVVAFIVNINSAVSERKKPEVQPSNTALFERVWVAQEIYVQSFSQKQIDPACERDVFTALESGAKVCTVERAIVSTDTTNVFAVGFKKMCLVTACQEKNNNCQINNFDISEDVKWTTKLRHALDLIHLKKRSTGSSNSTPPPAVLASSGS